MKLDDTVRISAYDVISRAVEEGVNYGWNRAHKHSDDPGEQVIKAEIDSAVMGSLCEVLRFNDS